MKPFGQALDRVGYFNLMREISISDFKVKYNNSVLGYFWSLGKPLVLFFILYIVFVHFLKFGSDVPNFPLYLLLGIIFWSYFAESTSTAMNSVVGKGGLIRKVYFPREIIVISSILTTTMTFFLNLLVVFGFIFFARIPISFDWLLFIPIFIQLYLLTLGTSLILSAMFVKYRDVGHIWEVLTQALFYATPIIYPISLIPEKYHAILLLSPIAQIIQDARYILISHQTTTSWYSLGAGVLIPLALTLILLVVGIKYFRSASADFAEDV